MGLISHLCCDGQDKADRQHATGKADWFNGDVGDGQISSNGGSHRIYQITEHHQNAEWHLSEYKTVSKILTSLK